AGAARRTKAQDTVSAVRFGYFNTPAPWLLGKAEGTFEKRLGGPIKWVEVNSGAAALTAVAAGEVDVQHLGSTPTTAAIVRGVRIYVVCYEGVIATSERLIARPEIRTMKDLEGRRVAFPPGSTSHYGLNAALKSFKVDVSKVKLLGLAPPDMVAAW